MRNSIRYWDANGEWPERREERERESGRALRRIRDSTPDLNFLQRFCLNFIFETYIVYSRREKYNTTLDIETFKRKVHPSFDNSFPPRNQCDASHAPLDSLSVLQPIEHCGQISTLLLRKNVFNAPKSDHPSIETGRRFFIHVFRSQPR